MNALHNHPKRFLFATWEGGGNVAPALTVARKLVERGHRVRFLCDASAREEALARGVEFRAWQAAPNRPDRSPETCPVRDWEAASPPEGIQRLMDRIMVGPALAYARDVLAELEREPADLVVASEMLLGAMAACESVGQPMAIFAANLCIYPLPGMPAFGPGLPPPRDAAEEALRDEMRASVIQMFDTGLDRFNATRAQLGLGPLRHVADQVQVAKRYLLGTSRAFDFPSEWAPARIAYVGPQLEEPAWAQPWDSPWAPTDARPLVLVAFSTTFQDHAQAIQRVIGAAGRMPVRAVVTLGEIKASALRPAANTLCVASAPHDALMREAAAVVTHGGHGTVARALQHGLPALVVPHGRDQAENAVRVTERGAGLSLSPDASSAQIEAALRRLIQEPAFAEAAARLGAAIRSGVHDAPVAPLLEELAQNEPAPRACRCLAEPSLA